MYSCCKQVGLTPKRNLFIGVVEVKMDAKPVQNLIFDIDPRTKLPRNDIGVFMSKETSPEVRTYIENMLLNEQKSVERTRDVDDQTLVDTLPENGETTLQYEKRMTKLLEAEKSKIATEKFNKRRISRLKKQGFSDDEINDIMS